jgi:hypothetical protein
MGEEGFSSDPSLLYHRDLPSAISAARSWDLGDSLATTPNHPLLRVTSSCTTSLSMVPGEDSTQ